jgi:mono/diheme cytochrome c family protein
MKLIKIGLALCTASLLYGSSAKSMYTQNCASCHGVNGDTKAMGTSKAIKDMSVEDIENAVVDYASGERKAPSFVKNAKATFMRSHTKEELHELAVYIHSLK